MVRIMLRAISAELVQWPVRNALKAFHIAVHARLHKTQKATKMEMKNQCMFAKQTQMTGREFAACVTFAECHFDYRGGFPFGYRPLTNA